MRRYKYKHIITNNINNKFLKSISANFILRPVAMIISFLYTPILLSFLGEEMYGVWTTVLSIINWINICDVGIGGSFRNVATIDLTNKNEDSLRRTSSTAYALFTLIMMPVLIICLLLVGALNWNSILNTLYRVRPCLAISIAFICVNFVLKLYTSGYNALQKSEVPTIANCLTQSLNLVIVFIVGKINLEESALTVISIIFGMTQLVISLYFTMHLWKINDAFKPSFSLFDKSKVRVLFTLGIKFFVIQIAGIILSSTDNIIISNLMSPVTVTSYSTVNRFFGIPYSFFTAILLPFGAKCTEAKEQNNYSWISKNIRRYLIAWVLFSIGTIIAIPLFKPFAFIWLGKSLIYDDGIVAVMSLYYIVQMIIGIFSTVLNGLGEINIEMFTALVEMIVNIPFSVFLARDMGLLSTGVALGTVIPQIIGCIVIGMQVFNIVRERRVIR